MVVIKVAQIKGGDHLKRSLDYITNDAKTLTTVETTGNLENFTIRLDGASPTLQLVSGHDVFDATNAFDDFWLTKFMAEQKSENPNTSDLTNSNRVHAHHLIQSFSPDDNLTPEQVHEIGRKTALEFTGGDYQFVIATHMDRGHLHNHIIFNTTNQVTLKKFRWQKKTRNNLMQISDKIADSYGAKILNPTLRNSHKQYSAWRKTNVFKVEIKNRLEFLLKHSINLDDFKEKAKALDLNVDFSGKFVKYRLLDEYGGQLQERNTRDDSLSKRRKYSLEEIEKRLKLNQVTFNLDEIKNRYDEDQAERSEDFEMKLEVESWQVKEETNRGIYLDMEFGVNQVGTILIPARQVDKLENGSYDIFIKKSDFFYFINPDNSQNNRFMKGSIVINQLAKDSGELAIRKNANISKMDSLIKEFEFLSAHQVLTGTQFEALQSRFEAQLAETQKELSKLDNRISDLNKITASLIAYQNQTPQADRAEEVLAAFQIDKLTSPAPLKKELQELQVERGALHEHLDMIIKNFTDYKEIQEKVAKREREEKRKI